MHRRAACAAVLGTPWLARATVESIQPIDDRRAAKRASWRFVTDGVMGGVSTGALTEEVFLGRPALALRGRVRLENNGGFLQMALDVQPPAAGWSAIELDVAGNGHEYGLHLRMASGVAPWHAYRARFPTTREWQTVRVPVERFRPYGFRGALVPGEVRRLGLLALGEAFDAELYVARVAWVR